MITDKEREWINEEIDKTLNATPEQRLDYLAQMQELYLIGVEQRKQRGEYEMPISELDQIVKRAADEYHSRRN